MANTEWTIEAFDYEDEMEEDSTLAATPLQFNDEPLSREECYWQTDQHVRDRKAQQTKLWEEQMKAYHNG